VTFFLTRINVGDYETWKPMFDQDSPGARRAARGHRIFRSVSNPGEVFLLVEFSSPDDANEGRQRLIASGVLDRFPDHTVPTVIEEVETVSH